MRLLLPALLGVLSVSAVHAQQVADPDADLSVASNRGVRPLLRLGSRWTVLSPRVAWQFDSTTRSSPGKGRLQDALLSDGRGWVAVFGEAAMFTAQVAGPGLAALIP